jgi:putative transposase
MPSYPSRRSTRLPGYDYSQAGAYFTTLVIEQRLPLLGRIVDGEMQVSPAGEMAGTVWGNLERYYPGVSVDAYVVMPNHLHGIIVLAGPAREDRDGAAVPTGGIEEQLVPGRPVDMPPRTNAISISTVIQRFKTFTAHEYGTGVRAHGWPRYPGRLWQHRFYERVIRNERELNAIREYIANNPLQWHLDRENPDRRHEGTVARIRAE